MERHVVRKKQRKPRKDKGKSKLSTAGKLFGVFESISEEPPEESTVQEHFNDIISIYHEEGENYNKHL